MHDKLKSGIYCIENINNNKKYIGQSVDVQDRWRRHKSELEHSVHHNSYLQNSWNKYGEDIFCFYVLEYCEIEQLDEKEIYYIDLYNTTNRDCGYNLKSGGQLSGSYYTKETKEKISKSVKESYQNSNLREVRKNNALNQWSNPKIKEKIIGSNNGMYGRKHTDESKNKMSNAKKGQKAFNRNTTPVLCKELNKQFDDATTAGKELSLDSSGILKVCKGERKTCGGYHWEFLNSGK